MIISNKTYHFADDDLALSFSVEKRVRENVNQEMLSHHIICVIVAIRNHLIHETMIV